MPRSIRRSGQRGRASTRRRDRGERPAHERSSDTDLCNWIFYNRTLRTVGSVASFDCKRFLQETAYLRLSAAQRLTHLAQHAAWAVWPAAQPAGWYALRGLYDRALRLDDGELWRTHQSLAFSAAETLQYRPLAACGWQPIDPLVRQRIASDGIAAGRHAIDIAPWDALSHVALGDCHAAIGDADEALRCYEAGVAADPSDRWAALGLADSLLGARRWVEAITAYDNVPLVGFTGTSARRVDRLHEARAWCQLQSGDRHAALEAFAAILTRYEANVGLARQPLGEGRYLARAAAGPFRAELHERAAALFSRAEKCCSTPLPNIRREWKTPATVGLAARISQDGDFALLPILGDALEDAGCADKAILDHCRNSEPHGACWVSEAVTWIDQV